MKGIILLLAMDRSRKIENSRSSEVLSIHAGGVIHI